MLPRLGAAQASEPIKMRLYSLLLSYPTDSARSICGLLEQPNMSGQTPRHAFALPKSPAADCRTPVDQKCGYALREQIPRDASMRWVDAEFNQAAKKRHTMTLVGPPSPPSQWVGLSSNRCAH